MALLVEVHAVYSRKVEASVVLIIVDNHRSRMAGEVEECRRGWIDEEGLGEGEEGITVFGMLLLVAERVPEDLVTAWMFRLANCFNPIVYGVRSFA